MVLKVQESSELTGNETESIILECRERIVQALEKDVSRLKERAELDSGRIIAGARMEADRLIAEARQTAAAESQRLIEKAREEAAQITRQSGEEAARARQESARVINESKEKTQKIIAEVVQCGASLTQRELARAASEAKIKTSQLLAQVNQSYAQIIAENENIIKTELARLSGIIVEAEKRLQIDMQNQAVEVSSPPAGAEAASPAVSEKENPKTAFSFPGALGTAIVKESDESRLFEGKIDLEIIPRFNQEQTGGVPELLGRLTGSKVISTGGYASGNHRIMTFSVELPQPVALLKMLKTLSAVKDASERRGIIIVTL